MTEETVLVSVFLVVRRDFRTAEPSPQPYKSFLRLSFESHWSPLPSFMLK